MEMKKSQPEIYCMNASETHIAIATKKRSMAELDVLCSDSVILKDLSLPNGALAFWFARLSVLPAEQGSGEGSFLMEEVKKVVDAMGAYIVNCPNPYQREDGPRLIQFYKRHGFEEDPAQEGVLIRAPVPIQPSYNAEPRTKKL